ncbi:hypothetical protein GCM10023185_20440 [Hymenobacter saemangeumensis]|uniref:Zf-HC2 domain-containing protein n=1 Tax=Hymenobacter saemangeumensis TaxID=1084522 RepID=A0ABP8IDJ7_9BACT
MHTPSPLLSCQNATLLIERRADEALPVAARAQLWAHLRLCPYCRRYDFQSQFLARNARAAAEARATPESSLPAATRERLARLLAANVPHLPPPPPADEGTAGGPQP